MTLEICLLSFWHLVEDFMSHTFKQVIRLIWKSKRRRIRSSQMSTLTLLPTIIEVKYTVQNRV